MSTTLMIPDLEPQLAKAREGLANSETLAATFAPHFQDFREQAAVALTVQPDEPKKAATVRKALKMIRVNAEKARKELKEDAIRTGKAIDGYHAILEHALVPIETAMLEIEKAEERREAARRAALVESRRAEFAEYADPTPYLAVLGDLPEASWMELLNGAKLAKAAAVQAEADRIAKAEADRLAAEAERVERERVAAEERKALEAAAEALRVENARLAEVARVEREAAAERERLAKAEADRLAAEAAAVLKAAQEKAAAEAAEAARVAKAEADRIAAEQAAVLKAEQERAAAAKAEADRAAKAAADALAAERAKAAAEQAERDRIAKEAAAKAKAEQDRKDAEAEAERKRLAKIAADAQAEIDRAAKARADREAAEAAEKARAARAPDKEKLLAFAEMVRGLHVPAMSTPATAALAVKVAEGVAELAARIEKAANSL